MHGSVDEIGIAAGAYEVNRTMCYPTRRNSKIMLRIEFHREFSFHKLKRKEKNYVAPLYNKLTPIVFGVSLWIGNFDYGSRGVFSAKYS